MLRMSGHLCFEVGAHGALGSGLLCGDRWASLGTHSPPVGAGAQVFAEDRFAGIAGGLLDARAILRRHFGGLVQPVEDVPSLDIGACGGSDCGLPTQHANRCGEGFLGSVPAAHVRSCVSKLVCNVDANSFACKGRKIVCVESGLENLGELVGEWLTRSGLKPGDLAQRVRDTATTDAGKTCKRQHIEQLIKAGSRMPRYIADLERAMGAAPGDLLALRMPVTIGSDEPDRSTEDDSVTYSTPSVGSSDLASSVQRLAELLQAASPMARKAAAPVLAGIAESPDSWHEAADMLATLLGSQVSERNLGTGDAPNAETGGTIATSGGREWRRKAGTKPQEASKQSRRRRA